MPVFLQRSLGGHAADDSFEHSSLRGPNKMLQSMTLATSMMKEQMRCLMYDSSAIRIQTLAIVRLTSVRAEAAFFDMVGEAALDNSLSLHDA